MLMLKAITPFKLSLLCLIFSFCQALTAGYCSYWIRGQYFWSYWNQQKLKCESSCSGGYYPVYSTRQCYKECPEFYIKDEASKYCGSPCDVYGKYYSTKTNSCVTHCYDNGNNQFFNNQTLKCQDFCPVGMKPDAETGFCLTLNELCPLAFFKSQNPKSCALFCFYNGFADYISGKCVGAGECSYDSVNKFQTYGQSFGCVDQCPQHFYGDPSTKMCTLVCLADYPYKDPIRRVCSATPVDLSSYGSDNGSGQTTTTSGSGNADAQYFMVDRFTAIIIVVGLVVFLLSAVGIFLAYQFYCKKRLKRNNEWAKVNKNIDYAIQ